MSYSHPTYGEGVTLEDPLFVHPSALLHGQVTLREGSSVWPYCVFRAEQWAIDIGPYTNIQDFVMVHEGYTTPTIVGAHCSITHRVVLHGCSIGDNCLIGIGATVSDGAVIGNNCIVAGHAFVRDNMVVPDNCIVMGTPAKIVRRRNNWVANRWNAWIYTENAKAYREGFHRAWAGEDFQNRANLKRQELEAEFARLKAAGDPIAAEPEEAAG